MLFETWLSGSGGAVTIPPPAEVAVLADDEDAIEPQDAEFAPAAPAGCEGGRGASCATRAAKAAPTCRVGADQPVQDFA